MIIDKLLEGIPYRLLAGSLRKDISSVEIDSRKVSRESCFVAVKGFTNDAHKYIGDVLKKGASLIVAEEGNEHVTRALAETAQAFDATLITVPDSRKASACLAAAFFDHPERKLRMIGVTGTKGKTTTTFMIKKIMDSSGAKTGLIGTVFNMIGDNTCKTEHTTPEARDIYELLSKMVDEGLDTCIMEVSSQGLKLDRVYGIRFDVACFTNLYEDHIGGNEHPDMEDYFNSKMKIWELASKALINADTDVSAEVIKRARAAGCSVFTYGHDKDCDYKESGAVYGYEDGKAGTSFVVEDKCGSCQYFVAIPGMFNVYNALCASGVAKLAGIDDEYIKKGLKEVEVPGRLQSIRNNLGISILVDYAHNAASLENVLDTLSRITKGRIITVFGCGGDRSHARRFEMGDVSGRKSDYTIVTSDNPRTEDPDVIIGHIVSAIKKTPGKFETVPDRTEAIYKAISMAFEGDCVLIAGKGHEDYQIFSDRTIHFDDRQKAAEAVRQIEEERS